MKKQNILFLMTFLASGLVYNNSYGGWMSDWLTNYFHTKSANQNQGGDPAKIAQECIAIPKNHAGLLGREIVALSTVDENLKRVRNDIERENKELENNKKVNEEAQKLMSERRNRRLEKIKSIETLKSGQNSDAEKERLEKEMSNLSRLIDMDNNTMGYFLKAVENTQQKCESSILELKREEGELIDRQEQLEKEIIEKININDECEILDKPSPTEMSEFLARSFLAKEAQKTDRPPLIAKNID